MTTDPLDRTISAMWATRAYAAQPRPALKTDKCPGCSFWTEPPCQVCAQGFTSTFIDTASLIAAALPGKGELS